MVLSWLAVSGPGEVVARLVSEKQAAQRAIGFPPDDHERGHEPQDHEIPRQFLRVHRSTLVNVDRIKTLKPSLYGDYAILLRDGTKLTLSRGFRESVLRRLGTA